MALRPEWTNGHALLARARREAAAAVAAAAPEQEETYLRSISDPAGIAACFAEHGVVGVTGVLSADEAAALIREGIKPLLPPGCSVADDATHSLAENGAFNWFGVVGKEPLFNAALLRARLHPNVIAAYRAVYGAGVPLIACHDRAAWMRPAAENPAVATPFDYPGLHLDINPRSYFGFGDDVTSRASGQGIL